MKATRIMPKSSRLIMYGLISVVIIGGVFVFIKTRKTEDWRSLRRSNMMEAVYGIGTVSANNSIQFKSGVPSVVQKLYVKEGDNVRKGQALFELGEAPIFRAPFDGTITWLPVKTGESVFTQAVVMQLTDLLDRYMVVSLEQQGALRVKKGQNVQVSFDTMRDQKFSAEVDSIYSGTGGSFLVRITVQNLPAAILPGMAGDVGIEIKEHQNVFVVPIDAIESGMLKVRKGNKSMQIAVSTTISDATQAMIDAAGLEEGMEYLVLNKKKK